MTPYFCPHCGSGNSQTSIYCGQCGLSLQAQSFTPSQKPESKKTLWLIIGGAVLTLLFTAAYIGLMISLKKQAPPSEGKSAVEVAKEVQTYNENLIKIDPDRKFLQSADYNRLSQTLDITVTNAWHRTAYQERLQTAQLLWKMWANVHAPSKPETALIRVVDFNGNEVGGSRMLGGIWVQEQ